MVGDITGHSKGSATELFDCGNGSLNLLAATAGRNHIGSRLRQSLGESQPDTAGPADYDSGSVFQLEKRMSHAVVRPRRPGNRRRRCVGEL